MKVREILKNWSVTRDHNEAKKLIGKCFMNHMVFDNEDYYFYYKITAVSDIKTINGNLDFERNVCTVENFVIPSSSIKGYQNTVNFDVKISEILSRRYIEISEEEYKEAAISIYKE